MTPSLQRTSPRCRRPAAWLLPIFAVSAYGCSCEPTAGPVDGGAHDAGVFFGGLDASEYEPPDAGPRPPEPCDVPMRQVRFPVGDGSLGHTNEVWGYGSQVWVFLGGYAGGGSPPGSVHLFDLEAERELDIEFTLGEDDALDGVFEVPTGYELVVRTGDEGSLRVVHVDDDGRFTGAPDEPLALRSRPHVRLNDGRYATVMPADGAVSAAPARLELASPSGVVESVALGFETRRGYLSRLGLVGGLVVGIGYEDDATRVVRFEVDPDTGAVRLNGLVEGVLISNLEARGDSLATSGDIVTAALVLRPADDPAGWTTTAELFWWSVGDDSLTRHVVRPASDLLTGILALGGEMPLQTLVLAQGTGLRTWVTAARIRGPADVVGGSEPLAVTTGFADAAAWHPSEGTVALAVLARHELLTLRLCEGAP